MGKPTWDEEFTKPYQELTPHQKLITEIRAGIVVWERWLSENRGLLSLIEIELHEMSVRFVKGLIKVWRIHLAGQPETVRL